MLKYLRPMTPTNALDTHIETPGTLSRVSATVLYRFPPIAKHTTWPHAGMTPVWPDLLAMLKYLRPMTPTNALDTHIETPGTLSRVSATVLYRFPPIAKHTT